jgi:hypothetical protein
MASQRTSPTHTSSSRKTTGKNPKERPFARPQASRAHRGDTPEAKMQRARAPKTHPNKGRSQGSMRKH